MIIHEETFLVKPVITGVPSECLETRVAKTSSLKGATESDEVAIRRAARTSPSSILEVIRGARDLPSVAALSLTLG